MCGAGIIRDFRHFLEVSYPGRIRRRLLYNSLVLCVHFYMPMNPLSVRC